MDSILEQPHPHFAQIKQHSTQFYHKRCRTGQVVYFEKMAALNLDALATQGIGKKELKRHFVYISEWYGRLFSR